MDQIEDYSRMNGGGGNKKASHRSLDADDDGELVHMSSFSLNSAYSLMSMSTSSNLSLSSLSYQNSGSRAMVTTKNGVMRHSIWNRMIHKRWSQDGWRPPVPPSHDLFQAQLRLLSTLTGGSMVMFLFAFLNTFAFSALTVAGLSFSMLLYTIHSYILHLFNDDTVTMYDQLPPSLQEFLTSTTLHDYMTGSGTDDGTDDGNSFFEENRFLLLYFLPGITTEQKLRMVQDLPQRHRDTVFSPGGLARFVLPEGVYRRLAPRSMEASQNVALPVDESSSQPIPSAIVPLNYDDDREVPTNEMSQDRTYGDEGDMDLQSTTSSQEHGNITQPDADDDALAIRSANTLEKSPMALPQIIPMLINYASSRVLPQHLPPRGTLPTSQQRPEDPIEYEQRVEREILSTAIYSVVETYSNTVSGLITDTTESVVEKSTPTIIRAGVALSSLSGLGLLGYFSNIMGAGIAGILMHKGRKTQIGGSYGGVYRPDTMSGKMIVTGLVTTLFAGIFSTGSTVLLRSYVRKMAIARRKEMLSESEK